MWELRISCALPLHQRGKCVSEGTCTLNRKPGCGNKGSELRASLRAHRLEVRLIISERSIPSNPSYRRCEATTESSKVARHPVSPKPSDPSPRPQTRNPNGSSVLSLISTPLSKIHQQSVLLLAQRLHPHKALIRTHRISLLLPEATFSLRPLQIPF